MSQSSCLETMLEAGALTEPQFLELSAWFNSPLSFELMPMELQVALLQAGLLMSLDEEVATMH